MGHKLLNIVDEFTKLCGQLATLPGQALDAVRCQARVGRVAVVGLEREAAVQRRIPLATARGAPARSRSAVAVRSRRGCQAATPPAGSVRARRAWCSGSSTHDAGERDVDEDLRDDVDDAEVDDELAPEDCGD